MVIRLRPCMIYAHPLTSSPLRDDGVFFFQQNGGNTALHYAFAFGFHQLGKFLVDNGADSTLVNDQG